MQIIIFFLVDLEHCLTIPPLCYCCNVHCFSCLPEIYLSLAALLRLLVDLKHCLLPFTVSSSLFLRQYSLLQVFTRIFLSHAYPFLVDLKHCLLPSTVSSSLSLLQYSLLQPFTRVYLVHAFTVNNS